jgi:hypothetical protein
MRKGMVAAAMVAGLVSSALVGAAPAFANQVCIDNDLCLYEDARMSGGYTWFEVNDGYYPGNSFDNGRGINDRVSSVSNMDHRCWRFWTESYYRGSGWFIRPYTTHLSVPHNDQYSSHVQAACS